MPCRDSLTFLRDGGASALGFRVSFKAFHLCVDFAFQRGATRWESMALMLAYQLERRDCVDPAENLRR